MCFLVCCCLSKGYKISFNSQNNHLLMNKKNKYFLAESFVGIIYFCFVYFTILLFTTLAMFYIFLLKNIYICAIFTLHKISFLISLFVVVVSLNIELLNGFFTHINILRISLFKDFKI